MRKERNANMDAKGALSRLLFQDTSAKKGGESVQADEESFWNET